MAFKVSQWSLLGLVAVILVSLATAQSCGTYEEYYGLSGTIEVSNSSGSGAFCFRIMPQPSNKAMEVKSITFQLDPNYNIYTGEIDIYSSFLPMDDDRYLAATFTDCCASDTTQTVKSPIILIVYNTTELIYDGFTIKWSTAGLGTKTKFSMGLFQGAIVAIGTPVAALTFSLFTFRRGICDRTGEGRRLSRKTPIAERIVTTVCTVIAMIFFLLLTLRVFG